MFIGNGDGTFNPLPPFTNVGGVFQTADFNGDGKLDLLASSSSGFLLEVLLGNGDGTFGNPLPLIPNSRPLIADSNRDGRPDIAVTLGSGMVLLLNESGPPTPDFLITSTPLNPTTVAPGSSATSTITLTVIGGFGSGVTLSCIGLPSGATCSFAPASLPIAS